MDKLTLVLVGPNEWSNSNVYRYSYDTIFRAAWDSVVKRQINLRPVCTCVCRFYVPPRRWWPLKFTVSRINSLAWALGGWSWIFTIVSPQAVPKQRFFWAMIDSCFIVVGAVEEKYVFLTRIKLHPYVFFAAFFTSCPCTESVGDTCLLFSVPLPMFPSPLDVAAAAAAAVMTLPYRACRWHFFFFAYRRCCCRHDY